MSEHLEFVTCLSFHCLPSQINQIWMKLQKNEYSHHCFCWNCLAYKRGQLRYTLIKNFEIMVAKLTSSSPNSVRVAIPKAGFAATASSEYRDDPDSVVLFGAYHTIDRAFIGRENDYVYGFWQPNEDLIHQWLQVQIIM